MGPQAHAEYVKVIIVCAIGVLLVSVAVAWLAPEARNWGTWYNVSNTALACFVIVASLVKFKEVELHFKRANAIAIVNRVDDNAEIRRALRRVEQYFFAWVQSQSAPSTALIDPKKQDATPWRTLVREGCWNDVAEGYMKDPTGSDYAELYGEAVLACNYLQDVAHLTADESIARDHVTIQLTRFTCAHWVMLEPFVRRARAHSLSLNDKVRWREFEQLAKTIEGNNKSIAKSVEAWLQNIADRK